MNHSATCETLAKRQWPSYCLNTRNVKRKVRESSRATDYVIRTQQAHKQRIDPIQPSLTVNIAGNIFALDSQGV